MEELIAEPTHYSLPLFPLSTFVLVHYLSNTSFFFQGIEGGECFPPFRHCEAQSAEAISEEGDNYEIATPSARNDIKNYPRCHLSI